MEGCSPVPLASLLTRKFAPATRQRGEKYFRERRVQIQEGSSERVEAEVSGSGKYEVTLEWTGSQLAVSCECPHFLDQDQLCKHLWATVLAADAKHHLLTAVAAGKVTLDMESIGERPVEMPEAFRKSWMALKGSMAAPSAPVRPPPPPKPAAWKAQLGGIFPATATNPYGGAHWPVNAELLYIVDLLRSNAANKLVLTIESREPRKQGGWKMYKSQSLRPSLVLALPVPEDRAILSMLMGAASSTGYDPYGGYEQSMSAFYLNPELARTVFPRVVGTGRCFLSHDRNVTELVPLGWDDGGAWQFSLEMMEVPEENWQLTGRFRRGEESMEAGEALLTVRGGFLIARGRVSRLAEDAAHPWIAGLRKGPAILVPKRDAGEFLGKLLCSPALPALALPAELQFEEVRLRPRAALKIFKPKYSRVDDPMSAELTFVYEGLSVAERPETQGIFDAATRRFFRRDAVAEKAATALLGELGLRSTAMVWNTESEWRLTPAKLPKVVRRLLAEGWHIVAEGKVFRSPGAARAAVTSGLDWFELHGEVDYGGEKAQLPQLLQALKRGETMVTLDDGSFGLLPEEWLSRFGVVASMGAADGDHIRFGASQAGVLDALLATQPAVDCDEAFRRARVELERFQRIEAAEQPEGFAGRLRAYQCEGLGWMHFLRRFSFGGCLADDMGVGKTAQVLALLETRRELRAKGELDKPSLVVVPKSLIFNWMREVERFTPQLRVLDFTGIDRHRSELTGYDVILTTYGTLRRDVPRFAEMVFDYLILDEAQAIKNASTESAKAVRLLRGDHRLALSGTPVENHLGELWSLFEFLNPGILGGSSIFQGSAGAMRNPSEETRQLLAHALRPFILRRTKGQVAKELPAKVEQTIYCEMEPRQRNLYNELLAHYRMSLLNKIESDGIAKSKIQVLEALLRLRQAACHPALIDSKFADDPSAKLEVLMDQLREVLDEGHKALVFSQFTSLLSIVKRRLNATKTEYEYLDGKTKDREAPVERFQNDPECRLFLISLKAGGLGLNLTAADYVFILDPWWNPAVEAQAVDRAHRIGQTRQVFAYRLIARDTVEEKVLQLQENKRNLADAIIGEQNSLIRDLTPEDIRLLLS